jgi:ComF family protein
MLDGLFGLLAPHSCSGCGKLGDILCQSCKNDIISEPFSRCLECLQPTSSQNMCSLCRKKLRIEAAWCVGLREGAPKQLLARYKFASARDASRVCVDLLDATLPLLPSQTVVVPVPTASAHVRVRGFDHMGRITAPLAKQRHLLHGQILQRLDNTTQHFKTKQDRIKTAAQGLEVRGAVPHTVLLVDDIYTTGATVRACVTALRQAGAERVYVAIIARQAIDENK